MATTIAPVTISSYTDSPGPAYQYGRNVRMVSNTHPLAARVSLEGSTPASNKGPPSGPRSSVSNNNSSTTSQSTATSPTRGTKKTKARAILPRQVNVDEQNASSQVNGNKASEDATAGAGTSTGKTKITAVACQECQRKKCKCDGGRPRCRACARRGISECIYQDREDTTRLLKEKNKKLEEDNLSLVTENQALKKEINKLRGRQNNGSQSPERVASRSPSDSPQKDGMDAMRFKPGHVNQEDYFDHNKTLDFQGLFDGHEQDSSMVDPWTIVTTKESSSYTHTPVNQARPGVTTEKETTVPRVVPSPSPASVKSLADSVKSSASKKRLHDGNVTDNSQSEPQAKARRAQNVPPHLSLETHLHGPATAPGIMTAPPGQPNAGMMAPWRSRQVPFSVQQGQQYPTMTQDAILSQAMARSTAFNHMYSQNALQHDLANDWRRSQSVSHSLPSWSEHSSISGPSDPRTAQSSISGPPPQPLSPRSAKMQAGQTFLPQTTNIPAQSQQQQQQQLFFNNFRAANNQATAASQFSSSSLPKHDGDNAQPSRRPALGNAEGGAGQQHQQGMDLGSLNQQQQQHPGLLDGNHGLDMNAMAFDQYNVNMNMSMHMPGLGMPEDAFNLYSFGNAEQGMQDAWRHGAQ